MVVEEDGVVVSLGAEQPPVRGHEAVGDRAPLVHEPGGAGGTEGGVAPVGVPCQYVLGLVEISRWPGLLVQLLVGAAAVEVEK